LEQSEEGPGIERGVEVVLRDVATVDGDPAVAVQSLYLLAKKPAIAVIGDSKVAGTARAEQDDLLLRIAKLVQNQFDRALIFLRLFKGFVSGILKRRGEAGSVFDLAAGDVHQLFEGYAAHTMSIRHIDRIFDLSPTAVVENNTPDIEFPEGKQRGGVELVVGVARRMKEVNGENNGDGSLSGTREWHHECKSH
jgi:hypothetical protein